MLAWPNNDMTDLPPLNNKQSRINSHDTTANNDPRDNNNIISLVYHYTTSC